MKKVILFVFLVVHIGVYSQSIYLRTGVNRTDFRYTSTSGVRSNLIQSGFGKSYEIGYTVVLRGLERFSLDAGVALNEYNNFVGIPDLNVKWNTAYMGAQSSLAFSVIKLDSFSFNVKTGLNVSTIIYGKEDLNGVMYDIRNNNDFDGALFQAVFGVQANYSASDYCSLSIGYNFVKSIKDSKDSSKFSFESSQVMFGVKVEIL